MFSISAEKYRDFKAVATSRICDYERRLWERAMIQKKGEA
jgi:hypothetical protein